MDKWGDIVWVVLIVVARDTDHRVVVTDGR